MISINSNVAALNTLSRLSGSTAGLSRTFERLSSGLRISRASDDAAGLAVSAALKNDSRVYSQAIRNVNDAISMYTIAESATSSLSGILIRIEELAEQSANGVLSNAQRSALDEEAQALRLEFNRIIDTTSFNGMSLLNRDDSNIDLQVGYQGLTLQGANLATSLAADGTFGVPYYVASVGGVGPPVDLNGDGFVDLITASTYVGVSYGNGDGTFFAPQTLVGPPSAGGGARAFVGDFNGDGLIDIAATKSNFVDGNYLAIYLNQGNGTFSAAQTYQSADWNTPLTTADFNGDGRTDLIREDLGSGRLQVYLANADGSFPAPTSYTAVEYATASAAGDVNGDGFIDVVTGSGTLSSVRVSLGNGDGTFKGSVMIDFGPDSFSGGTDPRLVDLNNDGILDIVAGSNATGFDGRVGIALGNGNGTFKAPQLIATLPNVRLGEVADLNGDGFADLTFGTDNTGTAYQYFGNGDGTFRFNATIATQSINSIWYRDVNGDGVRDMISGGATTQINLGGSTVTAALNPFSLRTQAEALLALDSVSGSRRQVSQTAGVLGAATSRLSSVLATLRISVEQFDAAASQIEDADIAQESATLVRQQILQQAGAAVLAQANQLPSLALQLLRR